MALAKMTSSGVSISKAALNALISAGVYCSTVIPGGGANGLIEKADILLLPGVKICKSGILSSIARYSVLVGSIAKNGTSF